MELCYKCKIMKTIDNYSFDKKNNRYSYCRDCSRKTTLANAKKVGTGAWWNAQYYRSKNRAKVRNKSHELTLDDYKRLRNETSCYYCKKELNISTASIDRVNNKLGYTKNNTVTSCISCNNYKGTLTKEQFLQKVCL